MKKIGWTIGILILISLALYFVLKPPRKSPDTMAIKIRIPDTRFMGILPLYIAEEKGFFAQQNIEIHWIDVRDPGQAEKIFHAGEADLIMTTFANLMQAEVRKPGVIRLLFPIYESSEEPGSYILVPPQSKIRRVAELRGKTLGTYSGPSQKAYALIVLKKLGLREPIDVQLVQVSSATQVQGLLSGSFDALFTVEPYGSLAISKGARVLESGVRTKYISNPFWLGCVAIATSLAKNSPHTVEAILKALENAAAYIKVHENDAREILAKRTDIDSDVARRCALYTWIPHPNAPAMRQIQEGIDLLAREKLLDRSVDISTMFEGIKVAK